MRNKRARAIKRTATGGQRQALRANKAEKAGRPYGMNVREKALAYVGNVIGGGK